MGGGTGIDCTLTLKISGGQGVSECVCNISTRLLNLDAGKFAMDKLFLKPPCNCSNQSSTDIRYLHICNLFQASEITSDALGKVPLYTGKAHLIDIRFALAINQLESDS